MASSDPGRERPSSGRGGDALGGASADLGLTPQQALLYAADVARLYGRVRKDEARLARLEGRLRDLARVSLGLVEAASSEAAAQRIANELGAALAASRCGVYALRGGRYRALASLGEPPARSSLAREDASNLGAITARADGVFGELGMRTPLVLVPFPGRSRSTIGLAVVEATTPGPEELEGLELLARFAGVLLESHVVEETRLEVRRNPSTMTTVAHRDTAVAALRGESEAMKRVRKLVLQVAPVASPVLVLGETGTGKELVARAVHDASPRRKGPFIAVNCGALPENLVESEIFGHEAGAFTGANRKHRGKVELAHGGTLFLDELGEMPRAVQVKLLRFLQDSRYVPLGAESERTADVRVVAATNKGLDAAVASGEFREDLLYRLNVFTIETPPLREREDDVVSLAKSFVHEVAERLQRRAPVVGGSVEKALRAYRWPGNVRELRNVIERAVVLSPEDELDVTLFPRPASAPSRTATPVAAVATVELAPAPVAAPGTAEVFLVGDVLRPFAEAKDEFLARFEARYCEAVLAKAGGNIALAARLANMDKKNLHRKIRSYGLDAGAHKRRDPR